MLAILRNSPAAGLSRSALSASRYVGTPATASCAPLLGVPSTMPSAQRQPVRHLMTKRRRKETRKAKAADMRELLAFAKQFDPLRTSRLQVKQTFDMSGYDFKMDEAIAEDLTVDFALTDWYCAFEVVEGKNYVLPTDPNASDDVGMGPGVRPRFNRPGDAHVVLPHETGFTSAPPEWYNPVRGLVLDKDTAARHALIRAKGWKLVIIPQPLWEYAATRPHAAHYMRRDLILSMTLPLAPFEPRAVVTTGAAQASAASAAQKAMKRAAGSDKAAALEAVRKASISGNEADMSKLRESAQEESATGRSRKARRIAKLKVSASQTASTS